MKHVTQKEVRDLIGNTEMIVHLTPAQAFFMVRGAADFLADKHLKTHDEVQGWVDSKSRAFARKLFHPDIFLRITRV